MTPDGIPMMLAIVWCAICVVNAGNNADEPCEDGQDFVGPDSLDWMRLSSAEGVDWWIVRVGTWHGGFVSYLKA